MAASDDLLALPLGGLLEQLATDAPAPGGGAVAALVTAMSAGLVAMVARASRGWDEAAGTAAQAERLRTRVAPLAAANAQAYEEALAALALPEEIEPEVRGGAIGDALGRAADLPLRIAAAAADVALLAAHAAERGEPALRPDAAVAALLAEAAARSAAQLVEINLTTTEADDRVIRSRGFAETAAGAAARALTSAREAP
ncbi:MAG: cyclodeaminase/cyclohydrolase family protein [Thermoleophilia bacterium]|nr:cyclodeaminase/cyclohydrolase family protein [Thermoleophilia bacterium]